jgi:putative hydrolase of the HAD superfamily
MTTKAIVFDVGGVLVNLDMERCRRAFKEILDFREIDDMLSTTRQRGKYGEMEEGKISPDEFRTYVLKGSRPGAKPSDVDRCLGALLTGVDQYKVPLLESLAEKYDLYILSNNNPISMPICNSMMEKAGLDWRHVFKEEFVSSDMKMLKPDQEIFQEAMRRIGVPGNEILFIDDSQVNAEAACKAGMRGVHYESGTDLGALIRKNLEA